MDHPLAVMSWGVCGGHARRSRTVSMVCACIQTKHWILDSYWNIIDFKYSDEVGKGISCKVTSIVMKNLY